MLLKLSGMAKAIVAAAAAATGVLVTATADGTLSTADLITSVLAVLGALGVTYVTPNKG